MLLYLSHRLGTYCCLVICATLSLDFRFCFSPIRVLWLWICWGLSFRILLSRIGTCFRMTLSPFIFFWIELRKLLCLFLRRWPVTSDGWFWLLLRYISAKLVRFSSLLFLFFFYLYPFSASKLASPSSRLAYSRLSEYCWVRSGWPAYR